MDFVPAISFAMSRDEAKLLNPLVLAFVGDSVQTLYVRAKLASTAHMKAGGLHILASREVSAVAQSEAVNAIIECLTEDESDIFKRARNAKTKSAAKNADIVDYRRASGYEAVLGYLYLTGQSDRLGYLLNRAKGEI